ncbi:MAG TPA: hypothetical protein VFS59_05170 [Gemmatimonadaceae bacterium]|nr:hypothetical protein [Gemmatimonadaceae bacterium]
MSDPGKVIVALGFFATLTYIVRLVTLGGASLLRRHDPATRGLVVDEERMARLEQAVEAIALEVERISEGQRFTTKLLAERAQPDHAGVAHVPERRHVTPH